MNIPRTIWFLLATMIFTAIPCEAESLVENFESPETPPGWKASENGRCSITGERFKSGTKSLVWNWNGDRSALTCGVPGGGLAPMNELGCLAFWIYNETPSDDILYFEILRDGSSWGNCWYALNFKGWRPLGVPYKQIYVYGEHFMTNPAFPALDSFRLTILKRPEEASASSDEAAPKAAVTGRLFIDYVNYDCRDTLRADNQQPWVGNSDILHTDNPWQYAYSSHDISKNRPWLPAFTPASGITETDFKDMDTIVTRCLVGDKADGNPPLTKPLSPNKDDEILDEIRKKLRIKRSPSGVITGRPIIPPSGWCVRQFNNPPDGVALAKAIRDRHGSLLERLVRDYLFEKKKGNAVAAGRREQAFFDLCDHLLDQGFMEGNHNMSIKGFDFAPIFTLRGELARAGRLRDMLLASATCSTWFGENVTLIKDWSQSGYYPRNTDLYRDYAQLLTMTALMPDASERLQRLLAYSRAISQLANPDLGEPYAWDGTAHHHPMFHPAYTTGVLVDDAYNLRGTRFRLGADASGILKRSLTVLAFLSDPKGIFPPNIPGYTGQPLGMYVNQRVRTLAMCDTSANKNGVDPDLAAMYLDRVQDQPDDPYVRKFRSLGVKPAPSSGHKTLNGSAIAAHRRDDWLVTIAGQFKFRKAYEPNGAYVASAFNHYSRNGSVYVTSTGNPLSTFASGFSLEGWNSFLQPGATSYLGESPEQIYIRIGNNYSAFGGGTDMDGDGIWGMEMSRRNVGITDNMRFHKSAFCFGDRITLITTDIGRADGAGAPERNLKLITTLWQNSFGPGGYTDPPGPKAYRYAFNIPKKPEEPTPPERESCWVEGEEIKAFPWKTTLPAGPARWLIDNRQTGYYVHPDCPPIHVARRQQTWTYFNNPYFRKSAEEMKDSGDGEYRPTKGNFAVAWFDHGSKPDVDHCVYTLIPKTNPNRMKKLAAEMKSEETAPYVIRRMDAQAHILWDRASDTTGYLIFAPDKWRGEGEGPLAAVNRICSVMVRKQRDGELRISVASTDLDSWRPWAWGDGRITLSGDVVLTLDGNWELVSIDKDPFATETCAAANKEGKTTLTIPFKTFMPVRLTLKSTKI